MKHLKKLSVLLAALILIVSLTSCVARVSCISHIDEDKEGKFDGKCNNCGAAMEISNVEEISVVTVPTKTYYAFGEEIDPAGGVIKVEYKDDTPAEEIPMTAEGVEVRKPDMSTAGTKNVSVTYKKARTTFKIEVGQAKYNVYFNLNYAGAPAVDSQFITAGGRATDPSADIERAGYELDGWYTDEGCTAANRFDFTVDTIAGETTLYAKWVQVFKVTYNLNYTGAPAATERDTVNGKIENITPADRTDFTFIGWYMDAAGNTPVDYNATVTENTTVYAKWQDNSTGGAVYTVTFNHNYGTTPTKSTANVPEGLTVAAPATPTRGGIGDRGHVTTAGEFGGWYTDAACTTAYNFETPVTGNIELFAKWNKMYTFEAEYTDLVDADGNLLVGDGASGSATGLDMINSPSPDKEAYLQTSAGYYVTYLYTPDIALNFVINSDRAVNDAKLVIRITAEQAPFILVPTDDYMFDGDVPPGADAGEFDYGPDSGIAGEYFDGVHVMYSGYEISCNGTLINYDPIRVIDVSGHDAGGGQRPFSDFDVTLTLNLQKGRNVLTFKTANYNGMGGTMKASAPVFDCIKITTSAELSWEPLLWQKQEWGTVFG